MLAEIARPIGLTLRLLWRFWPQLIALVLLGLIANGVFMRLATHVAIANHMAGLALLTLVALSQLVVTVAMFQTLRPALPAVRAAQAVASGGAIEEAGGSGSARLANMVTVALLPFFAYYAAWGFLSDTVRQYSRAALDLAPFGESGNVLDVLDSRWLLFSVVISWLIRRSAKAMQKRGGASSAWQIIVVICETNWIFIGIYVISRWKDDVLSWVMSRNIGAFFQATLDNIATPVGNAMAAALMVPVEMTPASASTTLINLFFYMLMPVIWLVLAALIYGYDVRDDKELMRVHQRVERFGERYKAIPKFLRDFVEHFISGYRSRYLPIANGVRLTLSSGVLLIVVLIVGYRLIDWAAAWAWLGATRLIGPHELDSWQVLANGVTFLFGSPFQDSSTGILVEPLRICLLAAVLECAFALPKLAPATSVSEPA
ncbi:MAG TPA: hypothetical protein VGV39_00425 [Mesorhizobium sp.]|jgi:hypothetical protein|uniref:hypothetical protein n=1 Tax=Mesorhizobium sp. TaxID=1871066 RepID=UPI002DDCD250|nr:hypothetical protein [Mesorhizobium sp.]HEV2501506.1 hypothetical protein [Mesorhizobium sp.]